MSLKDLYLPTTQETKVNIKSRDINKKLNQNILREVDNKYSDKFFSFGHIRPGSIKIIEKSIGHKINSSDLTGDISYNVFFQCEVFFPRVGQEINIKVRTISQAGILGYSDNNKITAIITKKHQETAPELYNNVSVGNLILIKIITFQINSQESTIIVIGDIVKIIDSVYQHYQLPRITNINKDIKIDMDLTPNIKAIYAKYNSYMQSVITKSLIDSFMLNNNDNQSSDDQQDTKRVNNYWYMARSAIDDYELVHPTGGYNKNKGVAILPFKSIPITRAYFKMWELLHRYPDVLDTLPNLEQGLTILSLGEGPGGLMQALDHTLTLDNRSPSTFYAYTMKTDNKSLSWDNELGIKERKKSKQTYHLKYADVTKTESITQIAKDFEQAKVKADLIVADGFIEANAHVYNYEEPANLQLFYGQIVCAMLIQRIGGNFIIKINDIYTYAMQQLLLLLNHYYNEVYVTKQDFSRPANSEKYVICIDFRGLDTVTQSEDYAKNLLLDTLNMWHNKIDKDATEKSTDKSTSTSTTTNFADNNIFLRKLFDFPIDDDKNPFSLKLQEIIDDHSKIQIEHIKKGIHMINTKTIFDEKRMKAIKQKQIKLAIDWCRKYKMSYEENFDKIIPEVYKTTSTVNTSEMLSFSVNKDKDKNKDKKLSSTQDQSEIMKNKVDGLLDKYYDVMNNVETYKLLNRAIDPFSIDLNSTATTSNEALDKIIKKLENPSRSWFVAMELFLHNEELFKTYPASQKNFKAFINGDLADGGGFITALNTYMKNNNDLTNYSWIANDMKDHILRNNTNWISNENQSGDVSKLSTIKEIDKYFSKDRLVNLYISNPNVSNNISEEKFSRTNLGQILCGLFSLENNGSMIIHQSTFLTKHTQDLIGILSQLFSDIKICKPLASKLDNTDVYLIAVKFDREKWTKTIKETLYDVFESLPRSDDENIDNLPEINLKLTNTKNQTNATTNATTNANVNVNITKNLEYIANMIYMQQFIPMLSISMDLLDNPIYKLNSIQMVTYENILDRLQKLKSSPAATSTEEQEINKEMLEVFAPIYEKIKYDYGYIATEISKNWIKNNNVQRLLLG